MACLNVYIANCFVCTASQNRSTISEHFITCSVQKSEKQEDCWNQNFYRQQSWRRLSSQGLCCSTLDQPDSIRSSHHPAKCWWNPEHWHYIDIIFDDWRIQTKLLVTNIRWNTMIIGLPWLKENNPRIDWKTGQIELTEQWTTKEQLAVIAPWELQKIQDRKPREEPAELMAALECKQTPETNELWINVKNMKEAGKPKMKTLDKMIPQELMAYWNMFDKKKAEQFFESHPWDHAIDLKPNFIPKDCKVYPLTPQEHMEMDKFIDENLAKGYIWPLKSSMASPFFFVAKKSGDLRPCQDYWQLNKGTIKNSYPLPLISKLVDQLKGARYFTKLDVWWGYNNVRIKNGNQWKAAFKMSCGLFEPTVMFFGMCNSPATFQAMMDDIFIFTRELEYSIQCTLWMLQWLEENNLYLKLEKCTFWMTKVDYLGLIIQENQILMDPVKLNGIWDWPTLTTLTAPVVSSIGFYWNVVNEKLAIHGMSFFTPINV